MQTNFQTRGICLSDLELTGQSDSKQRPDEGHILPERQGEQMKQQYFILVLAHSLHGRLRRIHIPHQFIYVILALTLVGSFSIFGFVSSYARMAWKVANYNSLRHEADELRARYQRLQKVVNQTNEQLASLEMLANEVTVAYGIKEKLEGPNDISIEGKLSPTFSETVAEYNYLRNSNLSRFEYARRWHV